VTSPFTSQSLSDWLFYLESQHHKEIDLGLERVIKVAKLAGVDSIENGRTILVAGTNGKGTTIRFLEGYLLSLGYSVGVYGSPHIFHYNERVRINGRHLVD
jgi:dihydrofolate synthase/folylpolyglutamate synthase